MTAIAAGIVAFLLAVATTAPRSTALPPPPAAAGPINITTGNCAVVAPNIHAGGNVHIENKCDVPTEAKMLDQMAAGHWTSTCPYVLPMRWHADVDDANGTVALLPDAGSYFAQFDARLESSVVIGSAMEDLYLNAYDWDVVQASGIPISRDEYDRIAAIRERHPSGETSMPMEAIELIDADPDRDLAALDAELAARRKGRFDVHLRASFEDGQEVVRDEVRVYRDGARFDASASVLTEVEAYPNFNDDYRPHRQDLACSADASIGVETFQKLCAILIEKQALDAKLDCLGSGQDGE